MMTTPAAADGPFRHYPARSDDVCGYCGGDAAPPNGGWVETSKTEDVKLAGDSEIEPGVYTFTEMEWSCFDCARRLGLQLESSEEHSAWVDAVRGGVSE